MIAPGETRPRGSHLDNTSGSALLTMMICHWGTGTPGTLQSSRWDTMRQLRTRHLPTSAEHCPVLGVGTRNFSSADPASPHYPTLQPGLLSRQGPNWPILPTLFFSSFLAGIQEIQLNLNLCPFPTVPQGKGIWLALLAQVGVNTASLHCLCPRHYSFFFSALSNKNFIENSWHGGYLPYSGRGTML